MSITKSRFEPNYSGLALGIQEILDFLLAGGGNATEVTLLTRATEATLQSALTAIQQRATQATLAEVLAELQQKTEPANTQAVQAITTVRIPTLQSITAPATITAGAHYLSIRNMGNAVGTVLGANIPPGAGVTFPCQGRDTLAAISIDGTGTTLLVERID